MVPTQRNTPPGKCILPKHALQILEHFSENAYLSYLHGCPTADHLLTLSKVNVFRAFWQIISVLGMDDSWMRDETISPFATLRPRYTDHSALPLSLQPTQLQQTRSHHPWIDFFPLARMRDNLLVALDSYDEDQLCVDIMGFWNPSMERCGLLVWGEPTDPRNWEVTERFLQKWPWVIRGCPELIHSTNYWRRQREEKLIFRYL